MTILVTQGFWDLDDAASDCSCPPAPGACDLLDLDTTTQIAAAWNGFADGTSSRHEQVNDLDGANLYYYWYDGTFYSGVWSAWEKAGVSAALLAMTCQSAMDYN